MHARQLDDNQTALWNGSAGCAWVDTQELLDQTFRPLEDLLVEAVRAESARRVLDVGCGTGSTTLAVCRSLAMQGQCSGIDISQPMIAAARARARRENTSATFIRDDAQSHAFPPAIFDMVISRFGVMFFADPVDAFANLRLAARYGAGLRLIAWRSMGENPFMTTAEHAAAPLLPNMPARRPDAPGQFAFADPNHVRRILQDSGWVQIDIRPIDVPCTFPAAELVRYLGRLGPLGRALQEMDEGTRNRIIDRVRPAFDPYVRGDDVRFTAACWMISAQAPGASAAPREMGYG